MPKTASFSQSGAAMFGFSMVSKENQASRSLALSATDIIFPSFKAYIMPFFEAPLETMR